MVETLEDKISAQELIEIKYGLGMAELVPGLELNSWWKYQLMWWCV